MTTRLKMLPDVTIVSGALDFLVSLAMGLSTAVVPLREVPELLSEPLVEEALPALLVVFFSSKRT